MAFREVAALTDKAERKAALLDRLDFVWEQAVSRVYVNKYGDELPNPDGAIATRVIEVAAELVDAQGETAARRPVDLSLFNGGAKPALKAI